MLLQLQFIMTVVKWLVIRFLRMCCPDLMNEKYVDV